MSKKIPDGRTAYQRYRSTKRKNLTFNLSLVEYDSYKKYAADNGISLQHIFRDTMQKLINQNGP